MEVSEDDFKTADGVDIKRGVPIWDSSKISIPKRTPADESGYRGKWVMCSVTGVYSNPVNCYSTRKAAIAARIAHLESTNKGMGNKIASAEKQIVKLKDRLAKEV